MKNHQLAQRLLQAKEKMLLAAIAMSVASTAHAQSGGGFSLPGFATIGCKIIGWLTGELSVMIFFIVVIVTLLIGFFAKMDWTKILSVVVLFGLIKGVTTIFSGFLTSSLSCITSSIGGVV